MTRAVRSRKARHGCHPQPLHNTLHHYGEDDDDNDHGDHDHDYHGDDDHDDDQSWGYLEMSIGQLDCFSASIQNLHFLTEAIIHCTIYISYTVANHSQVITNI